MANIKERLDKCIVDRGLCDSRARAQALIMDGKVRVNGMVVTKPGTMVGDSVRIEIAEPQPYVSRGGFKMEKALEVFGLQIENRVCIDVGAATGGFTDCLLQYSARKVIAVDVGYGQLDWKLRQDNRVQVLEKTNIRDLTSDMLDEIPSLGVVDASFISLKKILPNLAALLDADGAENAPNERLLIPPAEIIALLKPQFEHRDYVKDSSFKGVVRGFGTHAAIIKGVLHDLAALLPKWSLCGLDFSPITGPKGNIEFLLYYRQGQSGITGLQEDKLNALIEAAVTKSYEALRPE